MSLSRNGRATAPGVFRWRTEKVLRAATVRERVAGDGPNTQGQRELWLIKANWGTCAARLISVGHLRTTSFPIRHGERVMAAAPTASVVDVPPATSLAALAAQFDRLP